MGFAAFEQLIGTAVLGSVGNPLVLGILLIMFFGLMAVILRLPGEVMFILLVPSGLWIFGLSLGLSGLNVLVLLIAGIVVGLALLSVIRR